MGSNGHTESRVEHIQCHTIALLRTRYGDQSLVAVVLRLIDFDHTATDLSNFINLLATLANNSADHVIGNENLLRKRATGHAMLHGWALRAAMRLGTNMRRHMLRGMGGTSIGCLLTSILHGHSGIGRSSVMRVVWRVSSRRHVVSPSILVAAIVLWSSIVTGSRLR